MGLGEEVSGSDLLGPKPRSGQLGGLLWPSGPSLGAVGGRRSAGGASLAEGWGWAESLHRSLMGVCVWGGAAGWDGVGPASS